MAAGSMSKSLTQGYARDSAERGFESAIGDYFVVRYPNDWPDGARYDFTDGEWEYIRKAHEDPFRNYPIPERFRNPFRRAVCGGAGNQASR